MPARSPPPTSWKLLPERPITPLFHAAECYIFEQSENAAKTHKGVHGEFSRLAKDDPQVPKDLLPFLSQVYNYKSLSDYEVGPLARIYAGDALDIIRRPLRRLHRGAVANRRRVKPSLPSQQAGSGVLRDL